MSLDAITKNAYRESALGVRRGDTPGELEAIRQYIRAAKRMVVPNLTGEKLTVINEVLIEFGLAPAHHLHIETSCSDLNRMPALAKALMALDTTECDLVIARGRLGIPGSGSMLVILDGKGRVLSAALSPSHVVHGMPLPDAVRTEMRSALERIGFCRGEERA
jgi:Uncharacterized protein conserved in archaea